MENLNKLSKEISNNKLNIMNIMNQIKGKGKIEFVLSEKGNFGSNNLVTYISDLMNGLWEQPQTVKIIIERTNINDLKNHLAPLFIHYFYDNIFSSKTTEENLLYVLSSLIKSEIMNLNNTVDKNKFLEDTPCGIMLEELSKKIDIYEYLIKITKNAFNYLKTVNLENKITFDANKMVIINFKRKKSDSKNKSYKKSNNKEQNSNDEQKTELEYFNKKYMANLDKSFLLTLIEENIDDKNVYEYLNSKLEFCQKEEKIFLNERLLLSLDFPKKKDKLLNLYQKQFFIVINFINEIIGGVLNNIISIPNSIKYICKIISELINKKFPSINYQDKNTFIAKFFFGKLLIPFLLNPIDDIYIDDITLHNLKIISKILKKFVFGELFTSYEIDQEFIYTPFNFYFIDNIRKIFTIFENLTQIQLLPILENDIKNILPLDNEYDYFQQNTNEVFNFSLIIYNIKQIKILCYTISDNETLIFKNSKNNKIKKAVEKLMLKENQKLLNESIYYEKENFVVIDKDINNEKDEKKLIRALNGISYYFLRRFISNQNYKTLLDIKPKNLLSLNQEDKSNNIIKIKNYFLNILYYCNNFEFNDFNERTTNNTEKILNELNNIIKLSNRESKDLITLEWYIKSLLKDLKSLPKYLTKNDYEELYNELERDINKSLKELDFEVFGDVMNQLKYANNKKRYYQKHLEYLENIIINKDVLNIIKYNYIPVDIKFEYGNGKNNIIDSFIINESLFQEKINIVKKK